MEANEYQYKLLEANTILINQALKQVQYDRTLVGEVVSQVENSKNRYWIKANGVKFEATAQGDKTKYVKNSQVYVLIPGGDYSKEKIILGSFTSEKPFDNLYTKPSEKIITSSKPIELNSPEAGDNWGQYIRLGTINNLHATGLANYNRMYVKFALNTEYTGGDFTITIDLLSINTEQEKNSLHSIKITDADLWGNPKRLKSAFGFQMVFELPNNFDASSAAEIGVTLDNKTDGIIEVSKFEVNFGFDSSLEIFSSEQDIISLDIDEEQIKDQYPDPKTFSITWSHYDKTLKQHQIYDENNIFPVTYADDENTVPLYSIYWCRKNQNLQGYKKDFTSNTPFGVPDIEESGVYWQTIQACPAHGKLDEQGKLEKHGYTLVTSQNNNDYHPDPTAPSELIKVIIKNNQDGTYYESNTIELFNVDKTEVEIEQLMRSLKFEFDDGASGNIYNPYTSAAALIDFTTHKISTSFVDNIKWEEAEQVIWAIPKNALFEIDADEEEEEKTYALITDQSNLYYDENYNKYLVTRKKEQTSINNSFPFKFKKGYSASANNAITCTVLRQGLEYVETIFLNIGKGQSNGTNYQFNAKIVQEDKKGNTFIVPPVLTLGDTDAYFKIIPELRDNKGTLLSFDDGEIKYEWYQEGNAYYTINTDSSAEVRLKRASDDIYNPDTDTVDFEGMEAPTEYGTYYYVKEIWLYKDDYYVKLYYITVNDRGTARDDLEVFDETSEETFIGWFPISSLKPSFCSIGQQVSLLSNALALKQNAYDKDAEGNILLNNDNQNKTKKTQYTIGIETEIFNAIQTSSDALNNNATAIDNEAEEIPHYKGATGKIAHNAILKITLQNWLNSNNQNVNLHTYVPIALRANADLKSLQGATEIVYDYSGHSFQMNEEYYKLPDSTQENISWEIQSSLSVAEGLPQLIEEKDAAGTVLGKKLSPSTQMASEIPPFSIVAKAEDNILWIQPIMVYRDRYPFEAFNTWDSSLKINEEDNYILSSFMGAGKKNSDNSFTGVFMGDIGGHVTGEADSAYKKTGLYGVQNGELRFKFDEDGEAYIGTGINNHISFKKGQFEIKTEKFMLKTENLIINSEAKNNEKVIAFTKKVGNTKEDIFAIDVAGNLKITGEINASTGKIGGWIIKDGVLSSTNKNKNRLYLASSEYNEGNGYWWIRAYNTDDATGTTYFGVQSDGKLTAKGANIEGTIKATNADFVTSLKVGENFSVDKEGNMTCRNATITGNITGNSYLSNGVTFGNGKFSKITDWMPSGGWGTKWEMFASSKDDKGNIQVQQNKTLARIFMVQEANDDNYNATTKHGKILLAVEQYDNPNKAASLELGYNGAGEVPNPDGGGSISKASYVTLNGRWFYKSSELLTLNGITNYSDDSDIRVKHTVQNISNKYSYFFDELRPVTFIYKPGISNYGTSQRTHVGFIANEVEEAMHKNNISNQEFAGLAIKNMGTENELYSLRYSEFIALNTSEIQKLKSRVTALETEIKELKNAINK